jgi:hypothetical protein
MTERGESRLIANKDWRGKLAQAIGVGIENYRDLADKRKNPMLAADYRRMSSGDLVARDANPPSTPPVIPVSN